MIETQPLLHLSLALAIGLLIGTERGWQSRDVPEGGRIAGIRTFGLIGFLGGLWSLLAAQLGELLLGFAFLALTAVLVAARLRDLRTARDAGITTLIAALVTFALGALAGQGELAVAAAGGVITMTLLTLKPVLHRWLHRLQQPDLLAATKLLLISVVILPVLPNRGMGPWQALNPYEIWLLVVLIAAISFAGYLAIKLAGARRGLLLTGLLGGVVSSTATTFNLARLARDRAVTRSASAGILLAAAVMFPRMLILVAIIDASLLPRLALPLGLMAAMLFTAGAWLGYGQGRETAVQTALPNPLELRVAVSFGIFLAFVMLAARALHEWLGSSGLYVAAAIAAVADVDAITLSLARLAQRGADPTPIAPAILLAAVVNTLLKATAATVIARRAVLYTLLPIMLGSALVGGVALLLIP